MSQRCEFFTNFAQILNSGQSRSVVLCGNVYDLFWDGHQYVPLIPFLCEKARADRLLQLVYELNGPIRISDTDRQLLADAWIQWKAGVDAATLAMRDLRKKESELEFFRSEFDQHLREAIGNSTLALELLRQFTICSRTALRGNLLIVVEAADMLLPAGSGDVSQLNDRQLRRISIVQDWFGDPDFVTGGDSVCLLSESRSQVHPRISKMPQVLEVNVSAPSTAERQHYIEHFIEETRPQPQLWGSTGELAEFCAGLPIHALRQLLAGSAYTGQELTADQVVTKVETFIQAQLGDDVVEFKKPHHTLDDVIGFERLKGFLRRELIPHARILAHNQLYVAETGV